MNILEGFLAPRPQSSSGVVIHSTLTCIAALSM